MRAGTGRGRLAVWGVAATFLAGTTLLGCGSDKKDSTSSTPTTAAAGAAGTISMQAGLNDPKDPNIAVLAFLPQAVTVTAGSTVEWKMAGPEPHSVTFFPPGKTAPAPGTDETLYAPTPPVNGTFDPSRLINSGLQPLGPAAAPPFRVTFPTAGTYSYVCVIHPQMTGTVNVVAAGGKVDTQAAVTARADTESNQWLTEGRAAKATLSSTPPVSTKNADGTTTWKLQMGTTTAHTDVLAFAPPSADVKIGDTVTFVNNSGAPHTASFAGKGTLPQNPLDPAVGKPAPGASPQTLNATDFFNTGLLPPNAPPGAGPPEVARSFSFVVKTAGTYTYVCLLHAPSGMAGALKVA